MPHIKPILSLTLMLNRLQTIIKTSLLMTLFACLSLKSIAATAEPSFIDQLKAYFTSSDDQLPSHNEGPFPLLTNPKGFDDGFNPFIYGFWQEIRLHPSTGAICGNGTPYKFYVRRSFGSHNMSVNIESGGACWDYDSCTGKTGIRGAANPNGIPDNYMRKLKTAWVTPFVNKFHWKEQFEPQKWNTLFLPYCTGDVHSGDKVVTYVDKDNPSKKIVWHHKGMRNIIAAIAWIKTHMKQPERMLTTGCSAGGTGSLVNYYWLRTYLKPERSYLLSDSGPIYQTHNQGPSLPLHKKIRQVWGFEPVIQAMKHKLPLFDEHNLGTLVPALADYFNQDRLAITQFYQDLNYSSYSYERFYEHIYTEQDIDKRQQKILDLWHQDINRMVKQLDQVPNFAYYIPYYRNLNESHCSTIVEFENSDIQERPDMPKLRDFIDHLLDDDTPLTSAIERDDQVDYSKPFNPFYALLNRFLE
jgi:hypothetical protein